MRYRPPIAALLVGSTRPTQRASAGRAMRMRGNHEGTYSHRDREFVDQIMMQDFGTNAFRRLHTNDALGAVTRMRDLGVPPFLLGSCLLGVLAQHAGL